MGALEESESLLDVSTLTIMEKHVSSSLSLSPSVLVTCLVVSSVLPFFVWVELVKGSETKSDLVFLFVFLTCVVLMQSDTFKN